MSRLSILLCLFYNFAPKTSRIFSAGVGRAVWDRDDEVLTILQLAQVRYELPMTPLKFENDFFFSLFCTENEIPPLLFVKLRSIRLLLTYLLLFVCPCVFADGQVLV